MKKMDDWYWVGIGFVVAASLFGLGGSLIAAKLTKSFRDKNTSNQETIIELNQAIDAAVTRVEGINKEIFGAQTELEKLSKTSLNLVEKNVEITENIEKAQKDLNTLQNQSKKAINDIEDFLIGGESYAMIFHGKLSEQAMELAFIMKGKYPLRNIRVQIQDRMYAKRPISFPIPDFEKERLDIKRLDKFELQFEKEIMFRGEFINVAVMNIEKMKNMYDYVISIQLTNGTIRQRLICYDIKKNEPFYKRVVKYDTNNKLEKEIFYENRGFELTESGQPKVIQEYYK